MIDYETIARDNHRSGMNCATAVYDALGMTNMNKTTPPLARANGGMCGAVLAAEQVIRENGGTQEDIDKFEKQFIEQHKHLKCGELRGMLNGIKNGGILSMPKTITLFNGMIAEYKEIDQAFILKAEWSGQVTEFALVTEPDDENGINAVKYTFEQLYKDKERWEKEIWDKFTEKLLPRINRDASDAKIGADDIKGLLVPVNIALLYSGDVHLFEPEGTRIEVAYKVAESEVDDEDFDDEDNTYYLSGTLEKGFDEFTVNDIPLIPEFNLLPFTLSDGEQISYNRLLGAYFSEVYFLDDTVDVYWEPNEDMTDANKAFELFEKVREKAEIFDKLAMNRIRAELHVKITELRKEYEDPELEVDDLMDDLLLTIMVYDCIGTFEFAYETWEPDLRITTRGSYNMPFTTVMIENISGEDN